MVLTRSMATTTNNQGDELRTTALERQVQTLAVAMECLTKQNHDLEEQLHQKNAVINTQKEDQEGTKVSHRPSLHLHFHQSFVCHRCKITTDLRAPWITWSLSRP